MKEELKKGTRIYYGGDMANELGVELVAPDWELPGVLLDDESGDDQDHEVDGVAQGTLVHGANRFRVRAELQVLRPMA